MFTHTKWNLARRYSSVFNHYKTLLLYLCQTACKQIFNSNSTKSISSSSAELSVVGPRIVVGSLRRWANDHFPPYIWAEVRIIHLCVAYLRQEYLASPDSLQITPQPMSSCLLIPPTWPLNSVYAAFQPSDAVSPLPHGAQSISHCTRWPLTIQEFSSHHPHQKCLVGKPVSLLVS